MIEQARFLAWTASDVLAGNARAFQRLALDHPLRDIANCSYAAERRWIGVAGVNTKDQRVAHIYNSRSGQTLFEITDNVLEHGLDSKGRRICYTRPGSTRAADLLLFDVPTRTSSVIVSSALAYRCTPSWFPDGKHVLFESAEGEIENIDVDSGSRMTLGHGASPAVAHDGRLLAWIEGHHIVVRNTTEQRLRVRGTFTNGLSWSPDGTHISYGVIAGVVDKETRFHTIDLDTGDREAIAENLRGLIYLPKEEDFA